MAGRKHQAVIMVRDGRGGRIRPAVKLDDTTLFKLRMLAQVAGMRGSETDEGEIVKGLIDAAFAADAALSGASKE